MFNLLHLARRSLVGKLVALTVIFLVVPLILYGKFASVDRDRQAFLLRSLQVQGRLAVQVLAPKLKNADSQSLLSVSMLLQSVSSNQMRIKLLLRPAGRANSFFLVAASPALDPATLDQERTSLEQTGLLAHLDEGCAGDLPLAVRYQGPSGRVELLTSITPLHAPAGCWLIITSYADDDLVGASLARPFSQAPEVKLALLCYGLLAVLMILVIGGTLIDLRSFAKLARSIRQRGNTGEDSFSKIAGIPELVPVAREFDRMVATLDTSARALREAAEDNAHALKAPIAAITQALEPLRKMEADTSRAEQSLAVIERALARLGNLVNAARRLDESAADLMKARLHKIDLAVLVENMANAYDRIHAPQGVRVMAKIDGPAWVMGTEDSLETVIENLLDNAISFSPAGGGVRLTLMTKDRQVRLTVVDDGPGVADDQLAGIFRRNFSQRPPSPNPDSDPQAHFGIGLAVVRRTIELLGGNVRAENSSTAGLCVSVTLPGI